MDKLVIIKEINRDIENLDLEKIKEVYQFVHFIINRDEIDPTAEIMENEDDYNSIQQGLKDKSSGKVFDWNEVK